MSIGTLIRGLRGQHGFGYRPDPADPRDRMLGALLGELEDSPPPTAASVANPLVGPKNQGASSACVGFAWSLALRLSYLRAGFQCPDLSALSIYYPARAEHGDQFVDLGTYLRAGARAIQRYGAANETAWPFSSLRINKSPSLSAFHTAHDRRGIRGYYRLPPGSALAVRQAIAAGYAVVGGWQVSDSFVNWTGASAIGPQRGEIVGGHALAFDSYDSQGLFSGPGSWGTSWGRGGRHIVTESFIEEGTDLWCVNCKS